MSVILGSMSSCRTDGKTGDDGILFPTPMPLSFDRLFLLRRRGNKPGSCRVDIGMTYFQRLAPAVDRRHCWRAKAPWTVLEASGWCSGGSVFGRRNVSRFEAVAMPHLDAAYNLARWLTRNDHDAEDVVQEAYLRAFRFFEGFRGGNEKAWILTIVRRTCYSWLERNRPAEIVATLDRRKQDAETGDAVLPEPADEATPESLLIQRLDQECLMRLVDALPVPFREALVLREIEDLGYREIGEILGVPMGTVMSRLARARRLLREEWQRGLAPVVQDKGGWR